MVMTSYMHQGGWIYMLLTGGQFLSAQQAYMAVACMLSIAHSSYNHAIYCPLHFYSFLPPFFLKFSSSKDRTGKIRRYSFFPSKSCPILTQIRSLVGFAEAIVVLHPCHELVKPPGPWCIFLLLLFSCCWQTLTVRYLFLWEAPKDLRQAIRSSCYWYFSLLFWGVQYWIINTKLIERRWPNLAPKGTSLLHLPKVFLMCKEKEDIGNCRRSGVLWLLPWYGISEFENLQVCLPGRIAHVLLKYSHFLKA